MRAKRAHHNLPALFLHQCPWPLWCGRPARKEPMRECHPSFFWPSGSWKTSNDLLTRKSRVASWKLAATIPHAVVAATIPASPRALPGSTTNWRLAHCFVIMRKQREPLQNVPFTR